MTDLRILCEMSYDRLSKIALSCLHTYNCLSNIMGLPRWLSIKESARQCRRCEFNPLVRKIPLEEEMATHSIISSWESPTDRGRKET